ncbi:hypothetical protein M409DRAFT_18035 [Zasmidium cellare ATCC 36951]|uniref:Aminoglycoside phosphotransferase domain-containing protein n=1 Tax=Zasmidium cellare ATCC 36951 TaxID=1080233 RepID=A0A6A6D0W6_ZASCE|nr:uncharacterized protein M409DRAFT_18035 [Zasmidium cellare ATCC 36951]KAF2171802.1 hypothetical protein M409DRAFT_18035 [Zasmidium cellare ATCC 36951]
MNLVRERTAIPVPKIYNCYLVEDTQKWCILMEYAEGDVLQDVWEDIPNEWKQSIISQLKGYMEELRNIKGDFIGAVDGTQCEDQFFHQQDDEYGPFDTEAAFHDALADVLRASDQNAFVEMVVGFIKSMPPHNIVLTHSDFAPRNIIVQDDKVVAILDWELTGYYPAYWEYVKAYYRPNWSSDWIKDRVLDDILEPYPLEHAVMLHTRDIIW